MIFKVQICLILCYVLNYNKIVSKSNFPSSHARLSKWRNHFNGDRLTRLELRHLEEKNYFSKPLKEATMENFWMTPREQQHLIQEDRKEAEDHAKNCRSLQVRVWDSTWIHQKQEKKHLEYLRSIEIFLWLDKMQKELFREFASWCGICSITFIWFYLC